MKISSGTPELLFIEKKGLAALFEIQKSQDVDSCNEYLRVFVKFLLQNGATFLALYIMKNHKIFNTDATNLAISNAVSINSKVKTMKCLKFY